MKTTLLTALLVFGTLNVRAAGRTRGDFQPEAGLFAWSRPEPYDLALHDALVPTDFKRRRCQLVVLPSFQSEWAVYVTGEAPDLKVVLRRMHEPLWGEMMSLIEKDPSGSRSLGVEAQSKALARALKVVDQSVAPISAATTSTLERAWLDVLARVRYSGDDTLADLGRQDGITYHMSHCSREVGCRAGTVWSPDPGTVSARLVEIGEAMRAFALAPGPRGSSEAALGTKAVALSRALAHAGQSTRP